MRDTKQRHQYLLMHDISPFGTSYFYQVLMVLLFKVNSTLVFFITNQGVIFTVTAKTRCIAKTF